MNFGPAMAGAKQPSHHKQVRRFFYASIRQEPDYIIIT